MNEKRVTSADSASGGNGVIGGAMARTDSTVCAGDCAGADGARKASTIVRIAIQRRIIMGTTIEEETEMRGQTPHSPILPEWGNEVSVPAFPRISATRAGSCSYTSRSTDRSPSRQD